MAKIRRKIKKFFIACKEYKKEKYAFGGKIANLRFYKKLGFVSIKKYIDLISEFVKNDLMDFTHQFKKGAYNTPKQLTDLGDIDPVWVCWLQGKDQMPDICQQSVANLSKHLEDNQKIFFLTFENIKDYVEIPNYIYDMNRAGIISNVAFTDILRHALLSSYGGLWIDSVIWITGKPFRYIQKYGFYSIKFCNSDYVLQDASRGLWTNSFIYSKRGNMLSNYCYNALLYLWGKRDLIIDYLLLDYIIWNAYQSISEIRKMIDIVPINNVKIRQLNALFNHKFDERIYDNLISNQDIHLINRHIEYIHDIDGANTFFGELFGKDNKK